MPPYCETYKWLKHVVSVSFERQCLFFRWTTNLQFLPSVCLTLTFHCNFYLLVKIFLPVDFMFMPNVLHCDKRSLSTLLISQEIKHNLALPVTEEGRKKYLKTLKAGSWSGKWKPNTNNKSHWKLVDHNGSTLSCQYILYSSCFFSLRFWKNIKGCS